MPLHQQFAYLHAQAVDVQIRAAHSKLPHIRENHYCLFVKTIHIRHAGNSQRPPKSGCAAWPALFFLLP